MAIGLGPVLAGLLPELRAVQRWLCGCSGLPVQFEWLCVGGACSQQRYEPCDGCTKYSAGSIAADADGFAAGESRAGESHDESNGSRARPIQW